MIDWYFALDGTNGPGTVRYIQIQTLPCPITLLLFKVYKTLLQNIFPALNSLFSFVQSDLKSLTFCITCYFEVQHKKSFLKVALVLS